MKLPRVMIAAPKSGSGKTIITCGLLAWLKDCGIDVRAYKCGPDYIDPMFHRRVLGIPGGNLDTFFSGKEEIRAQLSSAGSEAAVIEGVMGIYDGAAGVSGTGSCYEAAAATGTPVILVIDVKGMGQTMLSVIKGILIDDRQKLIRGIILNRISERYFEIMRPLIDGMFSDISDERKVSVEILGGIPAVKDINLASRHLGLLMPEEIGDLAEQVDTAKNLVQEHLDTGRLLAIMEQAEELPHEMNRDNSTESERNRQKGSEASDPELTLAVARDEAFCFYYEENLGAMEKAGIRIIEFSPLHDDRLPDGASGILVGGGYPELYAKELCENKGMRDHIRKALLDGMPCLAECGGFMYLLDELIDSDRKRYKMCGIIKGSSHNTGRLGRFGYVTVSGSKEGSLLEGLSIRGHEFHYCDSDNNGSDAEAVKPGSGRSWDCMHVNETMLAGYPHLWYPSCMELIERFRHAMTSYRDKKQIFSL